MHAPSLHHWHVVERRIAMLDQHATATILLAILLLLSVGYVLSRPSEVVRVSPLTNRSNGKTPLSRLVDPQYAHESVARVQAITNALEALRYALQADRAYVAVYNVSEDLWIEEYWVNSVFEVTAAGMTPTLQRLEGLTRLNWLLMEDNTRRVSLIFEQNLPKTDGLELYGEHQRPVGYLGIEKTQEQLFDERGLQLLRETAETIIVALAKPLESI